MKKGLIASFVFALLLSLPVMALSLSEAKQQGLVGELATGYVGAVKESPEVNQLVQQINAKRQQAYEKIATDNNLSRTDVEKLAAAKLFKKLPAGQYYRKSADGDWLKK